MATRDGGPAAFDGAAPSDAAGPPTVDAGSIADPASPRAPGFADADFSAEDPLAGGVASSCFDGLDDDGQDDGVDCDDPDCAATPACCVGSTSARCCDTSVGDGSLNLDFGTCALPSACSGAYTTFGAPIVYDGALEPRGDAAGDSGMVSTTPLDLMNQRVTIGFELGLADASCGVSCLETAGIALLTTPPTESTPLRAEVGVTYSGARNEVVLSLDGVRWDAIPVGAEEATARFTLQVDAEGYVGLTRLGESVDHIEVAAGFAPGPLHLAVFGRNRAADVSHARVLDVSVAEYACAQPDAFEDRQVLATVPAGAANPAVIRLPSGNIALAFIDAGLQIYTGDSPETLAPEETLSPRTTRGALQDVGDPSLLELAGEVRLFVSATPPTGGARRIYAAPADPEYHFASATFSDVGPAPTSTLGFHHSTVALSDSGDLVMVAIDGQTPVGFYRFAGVWTPAVSAEASGTLANMLAVPGEERGSLSLFGARGAWQLVVGYRRGARWSTRTFASNDLDWWREVGPGIGPASAIDAVGVRDVDLYHRSGTTWAVYLANDGASERVALATQLD